jgi:hypothetical protein
VWIAWKLEDLSRLLDAQSTFPIDPAILSDEEATREDGQIDRVIPKSHPIGVGDFDHPLTLRQIHNTDIGLSLEFQ